jgi:sterol desaturase/sphingolipid hydroxylase (fatty acid hydroxylase superfamily)
MLNGEDMTTSFFIFIGVFVLAIILEITYSLVGHKNLYNFRDTMVNLSLGILAILTRALTIGVWLAIWSYLYQFSIIKIPENVWSWGLLFLLNEFLYYWFHRISHKNKFLWAVHVNHHSSEKLNFTTAARVPFFNLILHNIFWIPLLFLGFNPLMIFTVENISFLFAFFQHTETIKKIPYVEYLFNTPSHHRVHHSTNDKYINKNYGNTLIIFDRIFGTFKEENEVDTIKYGLVKNIKTYNLFKVIFHEWVAIYKR